MNSSRIGVLVAVALFLCCAGLGWAASAADEMKPISAVEAEKRTDETRDFLTGLIAGKIDKLWHAGKHAECVRLSSQTVELDPHDTEAWTDLGWTLANLNRDVEAVEAYRAGIEANPGNFDIHQHFGMFYERRKKYDRAVEQFRKAVENGAPRVWQHMLPKTLEKAGKKEEALNEWRALLKRFPDDQHAKGEIKRLEETLNPAQPA